MAGGNASCGVNYFCIGALLIFVGSVLLCALGFTIVLPYAATRHWPEVTCRVTNTSYDFLQCMCDQQLYDEDLGCITKYPCLEITVSYRVNRSLLVNATGPYTAAAEPETSRPTTGADVVVASRVDASTGSRPNRVDEATGLGAETTSANDVSATSTGTETGDVDPRSTIPYSGTAMTSGAYVGGDVTLDDQSEDVVLVSTVFRWWSDSFYGKCSLHECGVEEWNVKEAARFKSAWGSIGQSYPCYYRPEAPSTVILSKTPAIVVIHAVVWPSLSLISGCLLWLGLCAGCCSLDNGETYTPDHYR